jgi:hypothetical protein
MASQNMMILMALHKWILMGKEVGAQNEKTCTQLKNYSRQFLTPATRFGLN